VNDHTPTSRHEGGSPHVLPPSVLLGTAAALLVLTVLTVVTSRIDLGAMNTVLALAIASCKAAVVALFFMHLKYEKKFLTVVLASAVFFAVLLVSFVVFDTVQYQPSIRAHSGPRASAH
jgi:cytochrome c oxidase subunit 4